METAASFEHFTRLAREVADGSRALGLAVPGFRTPPRRRGVDRTLRRRADGSTEVAVRVHGRPVGAVAADLVDGVVAANRLLGEEAASARAALLAALDVAREAA